MEKIIIVAASHSKSVLLVDHCGDKNLSGSNQAHRSQAKSSIWKTSSANVFTNSRFGPLGCWIQAGSFQWKHKKLTPLPSCFLAVVFSWISPGHLACKWRQIVCVRFFQHASATWRFVRITAPTFGEVQDLVKSREGMGFLLGSRCSCDETCPVITMCDGQAVTTWQVVPGFDAFEWTFMPYPVFVSGNFYFPTI